MNLIKNKLIIIILVIVLALTSHKSDLLACTPKEHVSNKISYTNSITPDNLATFEKINSLTTTVSLNYSVKPRTFSNQVYSKIHHSKIIHGQFLQNTLFPNAMIYNQNKLVYNQIFKRTMLSGSGRTVLKTVAGGAYGGSTTIQKRYKWSSYYVNENRLQKHKIEHARNPTVESQKRIEDLEGVKKESGGPNNKHPSLGRTSPGSNKVTTQHNLTNGTSSKNKVLNERENVREYSREYILEKADLDEMKTLAADGSPQEKAIDDRIKELDEK